PPPLHSFPPRRSSDLASYSPIMTSAADRLGRVRDDIAKAASLAGRDPADVQLIAVTKGRGAEEVEPLMAAGQRDFGESRVQEARSEEHTSELQSPYDL